VFGYRIALQQFSCETAIFELVDSVLKSIDNKLKTVGMFLDLSKAFGMVEPDILLKKLYLYGVRGTALNWIESFILNRKRAVQIKNNSKALKSDIKTLKYGIGQGTKMGPILFLLYGMPLSVLTKYCLLIVYADDSNYKVTAKDNVELNNNISTVIHWLDQKNGYAIMG
jgi:hypothetical protein